MTGRAEKAIAVGVVALLAWAVPPVAHADIDTGVIRLSQPETTAEPDESTPQEIPLRPDARHGFDVEAFDGRFESLWFQRKAYVAEGRDEDVARQSDLIRDFVDEEGVRRLEVPAGALLIESLGWQREGSYDKALASLALAESLDPGRPQIALARAHMLWSSGAGALAAASEWLRAIKGLVVAAFRDLNLLQGFAIVAVIAVLVTSAVFALLMTLRYQVALRHDVEEWLIRRDREVWAKAGGWAVLLLPFVLWVGAGWVTIYWLSVVFRYMRRGERALAALLLLAAAFAVPAFRFSIGLYGLAADPTVRTTIAAANGGYDPDRIVKLRQLVDAHPEDPMYRFLLAGLYKNGRYFEDAFQEYKRVLDAAPSTYQARINLGNIYFMLGQYGEAMSNYRKAIDLRPNSALAYYDMYLAQSDSFKLKEASESLSQARSIDPAQTNRWLTSGSREGGGPKVIDAMIDFDSIFKAAVEGKRLRQWFDGKQEEGVWMSALAGLVNTTSLIAIAGLLSCGITLVALRGRTHAQQCTRCGRPFCSYCKSEREGHEFCSQCAHLFVLGDGLAPETKSMKLYEVERHAAMGRRGRRFASAVLPGASHILTGRAWVGCGLVTLWLLAWIGGFPQALALFERSFGLGIQLSGLRLASIPDVYNVDAVFVLALPLAAGVWIAGNAGLGKMRGV